MEDYFVFSNLYRPLNKDGRFIEASGVVQPGCILAVKGSSGSGKSTLLRIMARLIIPERGEMFLQGTSWKDISPLRWRRRVHYVSQKPVLFAGTLEDNFKMPFTIASISEPQLFDYNVLNDYMDELELPLKMLEQDAHTVSGGEAARIALIRALLIEPEVLLVDEPTAYLDLNSRLKVINLLQNWVKADRPRAIIMVSHQDSDLDRFESLSFLDIES